MSKSVAFAKKNWGILKTRMKATWKQILTIFKIQKWMLQSVRTEKVDEKNGLICLVSMFPFWLIVLNCTKKSNFLQFCADLSKKPKSVEAIYIYASKSFDYSFRKWYGL